MEVQLSRARTPLSWGTLSLIRYAGSISISRILVYIIYVPFTVIIMAKLLRKRRQMIMADIVKFTALTIVTVRNKA